MTVAEAGSREGELATVTHEARLDTDEPEVDLAITTGKVNSDLSIGADISRVGGLQANDGLSSRGMMLFGAGFIVSVAEAERLGLGWDNRPGIDVHIRPYINGRDLTRRSRRKMVIDLFGLTADEVRDRYPEIYQHLVLTVKGDRDINRDRDIGERWWEFGRPRGEIRPALAGLSRYLATVETSKHRIFSFLDSSMLPDNKLLIVASDDAAHLALLSSSLHVSWALRAGGWLGVGNDPVYVKSRCFDPFPFPTWTGEQRVALADAGERLDAFRKARLAEHPELTLTGLYNALEAHRAGRAMTADEAADFERGSVLILAELHAEIDALTLAAYGWPADLAGEPLLAALVALNAERAAEEARGLIRWLRPDYQRPRFAKTRVAGPEQAGDLIGALPEAPAERAPWPKDGRAQVLSIKGALAEAPAPLTPDALAARFRGRSAAADIRRLVAVLQRDGQVRRAADGSYSLLRAA